MADLPEVAGAGIGRVKGELRRDQRHILPRLGDLARNRLAGDDVAFQRRP
jgi:hypothetical protein